jgi:hypothetical protein
MLLRYIHCHILSFAAVSSYLVQIIASCSHYSTLSLWNASCCEIKLINYHVPPNATQRMYNIQFVLLKSHVSTILSGRLQVNTNAYQVLY